MRITITLVLVLAGCGGEPIDPMTDTGEIVGDAGVEVYDAEVEIDAGEDGPTPDAGAPDGGSTPEEDSGMDADGGTPDSGSSEPDAGTPTSDAGSPDSGSPADAGPPRPTGSPVDVSGSRCALDEDGDVWCWGRWTPVEAVRQVGTGFDSVSGSCALRGREVWCAHFPTESMIPIMDGSGTLELTTIAEYSDLARGCGTYRRRPDGFREAVCWTDGGSVEAIGGSLGPGDTALTAVSATSPRVVEVVSGTEAHDVNPPRTCTSNGTSVTCTIGGLERASGTHYRLGFALSCAHQAGQSVCTGPTLTSTLDDLFFADDGEFHDHAITWPIGPVDPVRAWEARGLCISGSTLRCYGDDGLLAYTVDW